MPLLKKNNLLEKKLFDSLPDEIKIMITNFVISGLPIQKKINIITQIKIDEVLPDDPWINLTIKILYKIKEAKINQFNIIPAGNEIDENYTETEINAIISQLHKKDRFWLSEQIEYFVFCYFLKRTKIFILAEDIKEIKEKNEKKEKKDRMGYPEKNYDYRDLRDYYFDEEIIFFFKLLSWISEITEYLKEEIKETYKSSLEQTRDKLYFSIKKNSETKKTKQIEFIETEKIIEQKKKIVLLNTDTLIWLLNNVSLKIHLTQNSPDLKNKVLNKIEQWSNFMKFTFEEILRIYRIEKINRDSVIDAREELLDYAEETVLAFNNHFSKYRIFSLNLPL